MHQVVPRQLLELEETVASRASRHPPVLRVKQAGAGRSESRGRYLLRPHAFESSSIAARMRRADNHQYAARMLAHPCRERFRAVGGAAFARLEQEDRVARNTKLDER